MIPDVKAALIAEMRRRSGLRWTHEQRDCREQFAVEYRKWCDDCITRELETALAAAAPPVQTEEGLRSRLNELLYVHNGTDIAGEPHRKCKGCQTDSRTRLEPSHTLGCLVASIEHALAASRLPADPPPPTQGPSSADLPMRDVPTDADIDDGSDWWHDRPALSAPASRPEPTWPEKRDNGKPNTWHEYQHDPETTCCVICGWDEAVHVDKGFCLKCGASIPPRPGESSCLGGCRHNSLDRKAKP